jgi:hypothetical protein
MSKAEEHAQVPGKERARRGDGLRDHRFVIGRDGMK